MRSWFELTPAERLELAYRLLEMIASQPEATTKEIREKFAQAYNLTERCVSRLIDLLWFSDMVTTVWRWRPEIKRVTAHYAVLPRGLEILAKGKIEIEDLPLPWLRKRVSRPPPKVIYLYLRSETESSIYEWWIRRDWNYTVYARVWKLADTEDWQVSIPNLGLTYSVKHRTIVALECSRILRDWGWKIFGYRFYPLPLSVVMQRIFAASALGVPRPIPKRKRTLVYDPGNGISVTELSPQGAHRRWRLDFSRFSERLPSTVDLDTAMTEYLTRTRGVARLVPLLWSPPPRRK